MKARLQFYIGAGIVGLVLILICLGEAVDFSFATWFSGEPVYEHKNLGYWLDHWYVDYGSKNVEAQTAVREMGTNALPYLVNWIETPDRNTVGGSRRSNALEAFKILAPVAEPMIPELVNNIGNDGNYAACALAAIGTNAIPALTAKLISSLAHTNPKPGFWQMFFSGSGSHGPPSGFYTDFNILGALVQMGTNASSAVPALITYIQDPRARWGWNAIETLSQVGHNQPKIVIPVLVKIVAGGSDQLRAAAAAGLGTFGTNALIAIDTLSAHAHEPDANTRSAIAVAIKQIAPGTPGALDPLIDNLEHNRQARQQSLYALARLGTNGVEALPALLILIRAPDSLVQYDAEQCLQSVNCYSDEIIEALGDNLFSANMGTRNLAQGCLQQFAGRSQLAFVTLLKRGMTVPADRDTRDQSKYALVTVSQENPTFLVACLNDADPQVRNGALAVFYDLEQGVPQAIPKLRALASGDPNADVRNSAAKVLEIQLRVAAAN